MLLQKTVHVLALILLIIFSPQSLAGDVSLAWDPSTSEGVVGYKVHFGRASGAYSEYRTVTNQTYYTVTGLAPGQYYFAVSAFDGSGNESGFSNEVFTTVTDESGPPLVIGSLVSRRDFGAVATITVDRNTSAIIRYKPSDGDHEWIVNFVTVGAWKRNHTAMLRIDTAGVNVYYKYQWELTDEQGQTKILDGTFLAHTD